jgi:hypothetical protein
LVTVTGGSEDREPPELLSFSPAGGAYDFGEPVRFEIVFSDQSPIRWVYINAVRTDLSGNPDWYSVENSWCIDSRTTKLSANEDGTETWGITCPAQSFWSPLPDGKYVFEVGYSDVLGNWGYLGSPDWYITIGDYVEQDSESLEFSSSVARPGDLLHITGTGFQPDSSVELTMFSDPIPLGLFRVNLDGSFVVSVVVPDVEGGSHNIVAEGTGRDNSGRQLARRIFVDRVRR